MLFCLLHPMDHNTGPLARKSTTLCALLLVSIAALLVLAVPGQADIEKVGVANHTLEKDGKSVTLNGVSKQAGVDLTYAEYVKRFSTVCKFSITPKHIELLYKGEWCTVELITNVTNMIKFTTGYKKDGCELDKCARKEASFEDGFSNLLPFAYSRNNSDIRYFTKDLFYDVNNMCADKDLCGGRCMIQTFLEVSWSKCNNFVYAHTHLIGEVKPGEKGEVKPGVLKTEFNLEINDKSFKMIFDDGSIKEFNNEIIKCVPRNEAFVKPKTWSIKNEDEDLKDKHLLVFHLLPQTASIRYKDGKHKGKLGEGRPKCSLFIHFDRPDYEFLQVDPQTTTTSTTTTTPKTEPVTTPPEATSSQTTPPEQKTTQKVQEAAPTEGGSNAWIWIIVIFVVIAVIGVAVGFYFYRINKKMKEEDEKESTKIAKKSSNEVKKDKTQPPKDSAPKEESTSKDPEQKKDSASKKDPAPDKSDAARSKQAGTTSNIPTDMMSEA